MSQSNFKQKEISQILLKPPKSLGLIELKHPYNVLKKKTTKNQKMSGCSTNSRIWRESHKLISNQLTHCTLLNNFSRSCVLIFLFAYEDKSLWYLHQLHLLLQTGSLLCRCLILSFQVILVRMNSFLMLCNYYFYLSFSIVWKINQRKMDDRIIQLLAVADTPEAQSHVR